MSTEEDREALARIIDAVDEGEGIDDLWQNIFPRERDQIVDAILSAGFHRTPAPAPDVRELIADAREWPRDGINEGPLINALADALEAAEKELAMRRSESADFERERDEAVAALEAAAASAPQVTDAMVEAARDAYASQQYQQRQGQCGRLPNTIAGRTENARLRMRAALEAALGVSE